MEEEKKKAIRDRWDRIIENEKFKYEPLSDGTPIEMGTYILVHINKGIELIAEAYGVECEEHVDFIGNIYKHITINGIHINQWVKIGKWVAE